MFATNKYTLKQILTLTQYELSHGSFTRGFVHINVIWIMHIEHNKVGEIYFGLRKIIQELWI